MDAPSAPMAVLTNAQMVSALVGDHLRAPALSRIATVVFVNVVP